MTEAIAIEHISIEKVDVRVMNAALKQFEITPPRAKEKKVEALVEAFHKLGAKKDLFVCDNCKGEMTEDWAKCPFCGHVDPDAAETPPDAEAAAKPNGKSNGKSTTALTTAASQVLAEQELPKALQKFSAKDLDSEVKEILGLKTATALSMYDIGKLVAKNYKSEFWKLRRNPDGSPKYTSVKQFWAEELGFSHTYCYSLMDVAENFSKTDVKTVGTTKLALVLRAPEKERKKLLAKAKKGASRADIEKDVKAAQAEERGDEPAPTPPRQRNLTITTKPGRKTIKLYVHKTRNEEEPKRAKRLADMPYGEMEFDNNTGMSFKLADKDGELVLIVESSRLD